MSDAINKKKRKIWKCERMAEAVAAVKQKKMGYLKASKEFNVPRTTLFRFCQKEGIPSEVCKTKLGRKPILSEKLEEELETYLLSMDARFFGLTRTDVRRLAYQLAVANGLTNRFSALLQQAGKKWLASFLRRHPRLSLRRPTGTSVARALGFNKESVNKFFDLLEQEMEAHNFSADRVFNCDETGLTVVQSRCSEIISLKGKRQVATLTSSERGSLVTAVLCMSAGGIFIPPLLIFPRKNMSVQLEKGAPPGTIFDCHITGWIQTSLFTKWFRHFLSKTKPSKEDPVLLILDGHNTHTRNIELLKLAKENYVTIICLPPHTSHKMQPLDKAVMGPLKVFYNEEIRVFIRSNQRAVTQFDVAELFGKAYLKIQSGAYAKKGFEVTGLYPVRRNIFDASEFLASEQEHNLLLENEKIVNQNSNGSVADISLADAPSEKTCVSPKEIMPIPSIKKKIGTRGRKPGTSNVITTSPYLKELETKMNISKEKKGNVTKKLHIDKDEKLKELTSTFKQRANDPKPSTSGTAFRKALKRKRLPSSSSDETSSVELQDSSDDSTEQVSKDNVSASALCMFCSLNFLDDNKGQVWIQCILCTKWAHEDCSGAINEHYVCDFCN